MTRRLATALASALALAACGSSAPSPEAPHGTPTPVPTTGVWISRAELMALPTSGAGWQSIVSSAANATAGGANLADLNSNHDQATLAAAIVAVRTGDAAMRTRAMAALEGAIGTEGTGRWLNIARNLGAYVIAADLLEVRSGAVHDWLETFLTRTQRHNNENRQVTLRQMAWNSGSNAAAHAGFVHAELAAYLGDAGELAWGWDGFRRYVGDRTSPHTAGSNSDAWQEHPDDPVGIQNTGATKNGCRLDGAISNDMSRGGSNVCTPGYTQYPWVGMMGSVPAAIVYARAGFPAFEHEDEALCRAADYLWHVRTMTGNAAWFDDTRAAAAKHVLNEACGGAYPVRSPVGFGQTIGFTDWTHPDAASLGR